MKRFRRKNLICRRVPSRIVLFRFPLNGSGRRGLRTKIYHIGIGPLPNDTRVNLAQATSEMLISFYCIVRPPEARLFWALAAAWAPGSQGHGSQEDDTLATNGSQVVGVRPHCDCLTEHLNCNSFEQSQVVSADFT